MDVAVAIAGKNAQSGLGGNPDPGGDPDPGGNPGTGDPPPGTPPELVYPNYDILIDVGADAPAIVHAETEPKTYCFAAGIHDATFWSDYLRPQSGDVLTGPTLGGSLLQEGVESGLCAAVIRGSRDISSLTWVKQAGREAWTASFAAMPAALPVNKVVNYRADETIPPDNTKVGWIRRADADNPPLAAGNAEEVFIAVPAAAGATLEETEYYQEITTASRCQSQDSADAVDGVRLYGTDTAGATDWHLRRQITTAHIDYAAKTVTIGEDPQGKVITFSCQLGHTGKAVGGSEGNITLRNLHFTQFPSDIQNGPVQPGGYRYDTAGKGLNWVIEDCHFSNHHGSSMYMQSGWQVRGCIFEKMGQIGVKGSYENRDTNTYSSNWIFENNIVRNNGGSLCYGWNTEVGGFKFTHANAHTVRNNWVHDNIGGGMWWDVDCNETIGQATPENQIKIYENLSERNFYGLHYELSYGHTHIYNNLLRDNGGFEGHGNRRGFTFRSTAQLRVGVSSLGNEPTKPIIVDDNVAVIHSNQAHNAGNGGGGHNSHGILVYCDGRGTAANVVIQNNDVIFARANGGDQLSLVGCYSANDKSSVGDLATMNDTLIFANNQLFYPGANSDLVFAYSDSPTDLGQETLASFQAKRAAFNANIYINDLRRPLYASRCPEPGFRPKLLPRA